jgi:hypothetical protein
MYEIRVLRLILLFNGTENSTCEGREPKSESLRSRFQEEVCLFLK